MSLTADYVIVGAGSAGCVIANRLTAAGASVVLLEAGKADRHPFIHVPLALAKLLHHPTLNWNYHAEPQERTGLRPIHWPRGKVLGGSSSINGMLYVRGHPADFDHWAAAGCTGWAYADVLPFFKRSESYAHGEDEYRGRHGPLQVEDYRTILPVTHQFVESAKAAGFTFNPDLNGPQRMGVGYSQMTRKGRWRGSTAATFLRVARGRKHLVVETNATATRLKMEGNKCVGVEYIKDGQVYCAAANREVIVCGGSVNSPQLLQLSGIGDPQHLKQIDVPLVHALPGVGKNLSDHYVARVVHRLRDTLTINELSRGWRLCKEAVQFALRGNGALTFGVTTAQVFCKSHESLDNPDLQLLFTPCSYDPDKVLTPELLPGVSVAVCPVHPRSRGSILARTNKPTDPPQITANYLSDEHDLRTLTAGVRLTRQIFAQAPLAQHSVTELFPGDQCTSEDDLEQFARHYGTTLYHPVGTCKMGVDVNAVVDPRLRVHGVGQLRVADASIMPTLTTGNTNAPTIMIGEKAADMILEDKASNLVV